MARWKWRGWGEWGLVCLFSFCFVNFGGFVWLFFLGLVIGFVLYLLLVCCFWGGEGLNDGKGKLLKEKYDLSWHWLIFLPVSFCRNSGCSFRYSKMTSFSTPSENVQQTDWGLRQKDAAQPKMTMSLALRTRSNRIALKT